MISRCDKRREIKFVAKLENRIRQMKIIRIFNPNGKMTVFPILEKICFFKANSVTFLTKYFKFKNFITLYCKSIDNFPQLSYSSIT